MKTSPSFLSWPCHFFGSVPHGKPSPQQLSRWLCLACRCGRIVSAKEGEKLSEQLENRFAVRGEAFWTSPVISDTCSPRGSAENWEISACRLCFSSRRGGNSVLNQVHTLWQRDDGVCHQPPRESLIKGQFGCPIVARIRKISRSLEPLSRIFLQSWLISGEVSQQFYLAERKGRFK